jgi:hypothetical protein
MKNELNTLSEQPVDNLAHPVAGARASNTPILFFGANLGHPVAQNPFSQQVRARIRQVIHTGFGKKIPTNPLSKVGCDSS